MCAASVPTLHYVVRRAGGAARAKLSVERTLLVFEIAPVDRAVLEAAAAAAGSDFDDNVQSAAAEQAGRDAIVTRDPKGFRASRLRVLSAAELEAELSPPPPPPSAP